MQHLHSSMELQGASPAHSPQKRSSTPGSDSRRSPSFYRSSMLRGECGSDLYRPQGAGLWVWILLWALVAPGACGLTPDDEELIVELHNFYRGKVSPSASAMMPLKWDSNLQVVAGNYATKCTWVHNPQLVDTGENKYASAELDIRTAMEQWFMENLHYNYHNNSCEDGLMCGDYTQMVWADTHRVGCEVHTCATMEGTDLGGPTELLVCNYYPGGNYEKQRPYEEGDWCSRCPEDLQYCENLLCVRDHGYDPEDEDTTTLQPTQPTIKDDRDETVSLPSDTAQPPVTSAPPSRKESMPPTPSEGMPLATHPSTPEVDPPTPKPVVVEDTEEPKARATSCCKYDNLLVTTFLCLVGALALRL